jgi:hypothetical protein
LGGSPVDTCGCIDAKILDTDFGFDLYNTSRSWGLLFDTFLKFEKDPN